MKKAFNVLLTILVCSSSFAQGQGPSKLTIAYHEDIREYKTTPPYGLEKVQKLIKTQTIRREDQDGDDSGTDSLPEKLYRSLSLREKFTYNMIYGESYSQNCDAGWVYPDEEKKIYGRLPDLFGEENWSSRQLDFFDVNKDTAIALMTESIGRTKRVGLNYKQVIVNINATSMIPLLISTYNVKKNDHDILTVLMLLMKNNAYPVFLESISFKKLYAGQDSYYNGSLVFNFANEALIIQRATDFYNGLAK